MPTCEDIAILSAYLPRLQNWHQPYAAWITQSGNFPYPKYVDWVRDLFRDAGQPVWCDYEYDPRSTGELLDDRTYISQASLEEIKTLLTACVRGERFCDGYWENLLEQGTILHILLRLKTIEMEQCQSQP